MKSSIVIVDIGMGNLKSLMAAINAVCDKNVIVSNSYNEILNASHIILPGVGSFAAAISKIYSTQIDIALHDACIHNGKPLLGICIGMQLMGMSSTEGGMNKGLCFFNGDVKRFNCYSLTVPHVGYNQVKLNSTSSVLFEGLADGSDFYFTHSYRMMSDEKKAILGYTNHEEDFISFFENDNLYGAQFHPELSKSNGLQFLQNFLRL